MSSSTATQIFPTPWLKLDAARSARQISASRAPFAIWTTMSLRRFVSGSCMTTRFTLRMLQVWRRCCVKIGSYATFLMTLDSDGVTWLMNDTQMASLRCVIAVISKNGFSWRGCIYPCDSPNGPSSSSSCVLI